MSAPTVKLGPNGVPTLYVQNRPFFCRAGEIHNSSASSLEFTEKQLWPALRGMNLNSVIVPIYWEKLEETEGVYDFTLVDGLIDQARWEDMKLIFLWFGLWKNAESMYVPGWMKKNTADYFRAETVTGEKLPTVSPLCAAAVEKDARTFTALLKHLREYDGEDNTVIAVQVENEIGLLGTDRDYSPVAEKAFTGPVPEALAKLTGKSGTWQEVYGAQAGESFMAWHFASAVETIAAAGKAKYNLPCYANAWLRQYPWYPGSYPSGGPVAEMHPIWKTAAPSLFALGPDVYVPYCADVMDEYAAPENPLFIPEIRKDAVASSYALYAFAGKNAVCFSPFGIEDLALPPEQQDCPPREVMEALNIDPSAFDVTGSRDCLSATYGLLEELEPLLLKYRGTEKLKAFVRHGENDYGAFVPFTDYDLTVSYGPRISGKPLGCGAVFELEKDCFLVIGMHCGMGFHVKPGVRAKADILRLEEGTVKAGEWEPGRVLNGDEKMSLRFGDMPTALLVRLYQY